MRTQLGTLHPLLGCPNDAWSSRRIDPDERSALDAPKSSSNAPRGRASWKGAGAVPPGPFRAPSAGHSYISFLICSDNQDMLLRNQTRKGGS
jgi:hypothetical protein